MRPMSLFIVVVIAAAACTPTEQESISTTVAPTTTTAPTTDTPECLSGELPFVEQGVVAALDSQGRDAEAIAGIRWYALDGCERIEIEFLSATGSPPPASDPLGYRYSPNPGSFA